jgi:hypothetical protein
MDRCCGASIGVGLVWMLFAVWPVVGLAGTPVSVGVRGHYGFLWGHRSNSWILVERHSAAWELFAERQVNGDRPWHTDYLLPVYGLAVLYTDLGSPGRIGAAVRVLPYLHLPFARNERMSVGLRVGWGLGVISKPFDRLENGKQIAIGSRLNTAIQLMAEYRRTVGQWTLSLGLGLDHWSNGAYRLPNLGLNYVSTSFGVARSLGNAGPKPALVVSSEPLAQDPEWRIIAAAGINEAGAPYSGQRSVFVLQGTRSWGLSRRSVLSVGVDVLNKGTLAIVQPQLGDRSRAGLTQLGVHGGYALLFGRGELFMQLGAYVYTPAPDRQPMYQRIGMRYRSGRRLLWNISLKSHSAVADHWEFGVGYRWN